MNDEEHSDSEFYYTKARNSRGALVTVVEILTKLKQAEIRRNRTEKLVPVVLIFVVKSAI